MDKEVEMADTMLYETFSNKLNEYLVLHKGNFSKALKLMQKDSLDILCENGLENISELELTKNKIYLGYINGFRHGLRFINDLMECKQKQNKGDFIKIESLNDINLVGFIRE